MTDMNTTLDTQLELRRCPHCSVDNPTLNRHGNSFDTSDYKGGNKRKWASYTCSRCGGVVIASAPNNGRPVQEMYPEATDVDKSIPSPAGDYLIQAIESRHAPAGAVMLTASSVDAMLKEKGYTKGSLYDRIDKAAEDHLITKEMAKWAHEVRLDANKPRHADKSEPLPREADAERSIAFAEALGEFLFVLPSRVAQGLEEADKEPEGSDQ